MISELKADNGARCRNLDMVFNDFFVLFTGDFPPPLHPRCIDSGKSFATESKLSRNDDAEAGGWYIRDVQWLQEQHNSRCSKLDRNFGTCSRH